MIETNGTLTEKPLYSYTLSSMDMRYIEIGRRDIYLRNEPDLGLIFRGEFSGCGSSCFADLNEILLEYSLSCEGCWEDEEARKKVERFGRDLGKILVNNTFQDISKLSDTDKIIRAFKCIFNSMNVKYSLVQNGNYLQYTLVYCPLRESAQKTGLIRGVELAHLAFVSLCKNILKILTTNWVLLKPSEQESGLPINKIVVAKN